MKLSSQMTERPGDLETGFSSDEINKTHAVLSKFPTGSQVSLAKVIDGRPYFYGAINRDGDIDSIDNAHHIFDIGSVAKVLTSALLAQSVVEGKLCLDDDIAPYLGIALRGDAKISFRQLSNHTSGLPRLPPGLVWNALFKNSDNPYKDFDESSLLNYLQHQLKQKKTDKSRYSNLGAGLLGYTLSRINQCSFEALLQKELCGPLELNSTTTERTKSRDKLVIGQDKKGKQIPFWDTASLTGAGGIYSNVTDLTTFLLANFAPSNKALQIQQQLTHEINKQVSVALGWLFIRPLSESSQPFYWHSGGTSGFSSHLLMNSETKSGLVLLSNISSMYLLKGRHLENLAFSLFKNTQTARS